MIPRLLHQTSQDVVHPIAFSNDTGSWKRLHPGWDFRFWSDADLAGFVDSRCPDYCDLFRGYPNPVMRADLGRYLVLREFGGVYVDLGTEAVASLEPLLTSDVPLFAREPQAHAALEFIRSRGFRSVISNAIMLSPAGHPFWDHLLTLIRRCRHAHNPLDATGPFVLTASVEQAPAATAPRVLPAHTFFPVDKLGNTVSGDGSTLDTLAIHHWAETWQEPKASNASNAPSTSVTTGQDIAGTAAEADRFIQTINRAIVNTPIPKNRRVLVAVPVRDAAETIDALLEQILALRYPRGQLSLAFLEGDSLDDSLDRLRALARRHADGFRRMDVIKRDFGTMMPSPRWDPAAQRSRRGHIAQVRNELVRRALQDEDWLLWIDADIVRFPDDIVATLLSTGARIVHPNAVRIPGGPSMDLNAWTIERQLSHETMAPWIRDGLLQPPMSFGRLYLSDLRYRDIVPLHSVGGTMLLVDANLHRAGLLFPESPYRYLIETEAFGAAACDIGVVPVGLPNVEVVHSRR
jgi:Anp1 protein/glycosyl transferase-like sugar-binding protein